MRAGDPREGDRRGAVGEVLPERRGGAGRAGQRRELEALELCREGVLAEHRLQAVPRDLGKRRLSGLADGSGSGALLPLNFFFSQRCFEGLRKHVFCKFGDFFGVSKHDSCKNTIHTDCF